MKYLLLICVSGEEPAPVPDGLTAPDIDDWVGELDSRGARLIGDQLDPPRQARTVRVRDGQTLVTDGPFAETKEAIVGFDVVECADLDEAIAVAAKHPMAWRHLVEVRPFWAG